MADKSRSVVIDLSPKKIPGPLDPVECPACEHVQDNLDAWKGYYQDRDNYKCTKCGHRFAINDYGRRS